MTKKDYISILGYVKKGIVDFQEGVDNPGIYKVVELLDTGFCYYFETKYEKRICDFQYDKPVMWKFLRGIAATDKDHTTDDIDSAWWFNIIPVQKGIKIRLKLLKKALERLEKYEGRHREL